MTYPIIELAEDTPTQLEQLGTKAKFWYRDKDGRHVLFKENRLGTGENNYEVCFFSRGLRHLNLENQARARNLKPGERLFLMRDLQNEHDAMALLLRTGDPIFLVGYAPRYYSEEFNQVIGLSNQKKCQSHGRTGQL